MFLGIFSHACVHLNQLPLLQSFLFGPFINSYKLQSRWIEFIPKVVINANGVSDALWFSFGSTVIHICGRLVVLTLVLYSFVIFSNFLIIGHLLEHPN